MTSQNLAQDHDARIARLQPLLDSFEHTHSIRQFLYNLSTKKGFYCESCSLANTPGSCGPTCSLLKPPSKVDYDPLDNRWHRNMISDHRLFLRIVDNMTRYALEATEKRVSGWERATEDLRLHSLSDCEVNEEQYWKERPTKTEGLDLKWTFEKAWRGETLKEDGGRDSPKRKRSDTWESAATSKREKRT
jgi:hypothetical protein